MKSSLFRWSTALLASLTMAGCGGGGGGTAAPTTPSTGTAVSTAITTAAAAAVNDTATNPTAAFTVLQAAGVPAVTVNSPPVVNFAVFSDGAVKTGLVLSNVRFALAKLVPGTNGNPDEWKSYISVSKTAAAGIGPGGAASPRAVAKQATTDGSMSLEEVAAANLVGQLTYNPDGYYSYAFKTDIKDITKTSGVTYEPSLTHRVAIQLSYKNAAGATVLVNPYFDFTIVDGKAVPAVASKTRKMADVASCNSCHEKLALHGGGRVDTQYCVMCHNPGTVDPESGNNLDMATMTHSIHAGRRIKAATGEDYTIWGYGNAKHDYAEVGFPQDLRNCTKCHSAANPATPQGDNWKTAVSQKACLACHSPKVDGAWETTHKVYAGGLVPAVAAATDMTNAQCVACHKVGSNISPEVVHWNQNEENSAKYKMNIESATYNSTTRKVTVKYFLADTTNGNAPYVLQETGCDASTNVAVKANTDACKLKTFGNLIFYVAYQTMVGQSTAVTEFSSYNNGGSGANSYAYKGVNDGTNHYSVDITLPADTATSVATGTARVISIGQVKEPELKLKSNTVPRAFVNPETPRASLVNVVVQNTYKDVVLTGALNPRREIVSNDKCNACHGSLGSTSGSNTLAEAFHGGARNTVEACSLCHDANRASSTVMTNGLALNESYQFNRMIHGIHGNSKRTYPFTHGNKVVGAFGKNGLLLADGTSPMTAGTENYAAEVAYPSVGLNCNACHVNNSYKNDRGTLGSVILKGQPTVSGTTMTVTADANPGNWLVISPKTASCTSCHDSSKAIGHALSFSRTGSGSFGNLTQGAVAGLTNFAAAPSETCYDGCHAPGDFKGVDIVHGQQ
jgi:OmcA/MtrC family decaheme c-type cytochrome